MVTVKLQYPAYAIVGAASSHINFQVFHSSVFCFPDFLGQAIRNVLSLQDIHEGQKFGHSLKAQFGNLLYRSFCVTIHAVVSVAWPPELCARPCGPCNACSNACV